MVKFTTIALFMIATLFARSSAAIDRGHRDLHRQRGHEYDDFFSPCRGFTTEPDCTGSGDSTCIWCQKSDTEGICMTNPAADQGDGGRRLGGSDWSRGHGRGHGGGRCCGVAETGEACRANSVANKDSGGQECVWFTTRTTASSSLTDIIPPEDRSYCKEIRCEMIGGQDDCSFERGCEYDVDARACSNFDCSRYLNEGECAATGGGLTCTWYAGDWWRSPRCKRSKTWW